MPILRVLSLVLLLGNLVFVDREEGGTASARVAEEARDVLADAAALVQVCERARERERESRGVLTDGAVLVQVCVCVCERERECVCRGILTGAAALVQACV